MSPDLPLATPATAGAPAAASAASAGLLEIALPLWHRRWRLLLATLLCGLLGLGLSLVQTVRFTGQASFVVQPLLRPSQSVVSSALPALAGLVSTSSGAVDLHLAILRSQTIADRIIDRFDLQRGWELPLRAQAHARLARRVSFGAGRRDGLVQVLVEDEHPQRAAAMANEYIEELRHTLRGFALEEARQRLKFYEAQLARARGALDEAQKKLQASGFDRAALRSEPRAAAEAYGRLQAEVTAAEMRLAATRRVRAEGSAEVQQVQSELAALRAQLARAEVPRDDGPGAFVTRVREFRYAETLAESIARQAEAARVDEASDSVPLQVLDPARVPELPSSPRIPMWVLVGALLGFSGQAAWVLLHHRMRLARLDPAYRERIALIHSTLPRRGP
ncbi:lipopolysaccharide biosynthesis protein [Rubrivivax sp. A210]|uniref:lipopolysaccharide biosynthesis protein n=1 Tax=Rubrivivax sp. A210 TaxID=2772301 RepID=UPI00191B0BCC|nr:lipopolysaccharide biosynthesis protein [Rubrivivax sp. A210]